MVSKVTLLYTLVHPGDMDVVCLHPGEYSRRRRLYLPTQYLEQTHVSVVAGGQLAELKGDAVRGVKGISPLV